MPEDTGFAQTIFGIIQRAAADAKPQDAEEEYEGRILGILFDALEEIEKLCQEYLQKEGK